MTGRSRRAIAQAVPIMYWLTRDADPETGEPSDYVEVWTARPQRYPVGDRGAFWLDRDSVTGLGLRFATWSIATAAALGTYPDDGLQCIRVGR